MAQQTPQGTNAVEMLKKDHQTVTQLFDDFERAEASERQAIATQIFNELDIHAVLEEEIFYPAVREQIDFDEVMEDEELDGAEASADELESGEEDSDAGPETLVVTDDADDVIAVSYEEHHIVKDFIKQLKAMDAQAAQYTERIAELKEAVLDHVSEEEELIFPAASLKMDVNALGEQMQQRRIIIASSMAA